MTAGHSTYSTFDTANLHTPSTNEIVLLASGLTVTLQVFRSQAIIRALSAVCTV
jgi:hypothetical protein